MNRLIITRISGKILTALMEENKAVQLEFEDTEDSILGNIYIGKVKDIVSNINAAFVELKDGNCGYYSLDENKVHLFTDEDPAGPPSGRSLRRGDEIIVQVARDAVKTKAPVLTASLTFTGRFCVLTAAKTRLSFSGKINDGPWKKEITALLKPAMEPSFGLIVRTNAHDADPNLILAELERLKKQYHQVTETGRFRTCYSLLYSDVPPYAARLRDTYSSSMEEILTDDKDIFDSLGDYLRREGLEDQIPLRLYGDPLVPLTKLYSIEKNIHEAIQKKVWLKSGGYLVIEPAEAMTVIDVNTGKYSGRKIMRETVRMINLEAAKEIARQVRLRNLSGIIIVDFINMELAEDKEELMDRLTEYCADDPVKTTVVDMTRLNLVEITRKKIRKPFYEQM